MTATPPTAPPTIAPMGVLECLFGLGVGLGDVEGVLVESEPEPGTTEMVGVEGTDVSVAVGSGVAKKLSVVVVSLELKPSVSMRETIRP